MIEFDKPEPQKVLLLTHEYGRIVRGGLGRVVNGIFNSISKEVTLDIFLIKSGFRGAPPLAYIYRKDDQNKAKCLYSGEYKTILHKALQEEKYETVHNIVCSEFTAECLKDIKEYFPLVKCIYSCHSIIKHEMDIRNNGSKELSPEEYIMYTVDQIQVLNKSSLQYLKNSYPEAVEDKQLTIIPNGIEESDYNAIDEELKNDLINQVNPDKNVLIFCLSRWSFGKGIEYLVDAVPEVVKRNPNVKFIIAGRKTDSWENRVEEYVKMIDEKIESVSEYVIPLGWLDNKARNTIFSMADICVMPSMLEYFPYAILEPMVCKVPIISSEIDSVTDLIEEDKEGMFFTPGDSIELAEKILSLIDNKTKRETLAQNAYYKVKTQYNWQTVSDQYVDMYRDLKIEKFEDLKIV